MVRAENMGLEDSAKLLIVNDNHCQYDSTLKQGRFINSKFHHFCRGFKKLEPFLSSPCVGYMSHHDCINIDGINVIPRISYGTAFAFYLRAPFFYLRYFLQFLKLFKRFDRIMLVLPASSAPSAYFASLMLSKKVVCYIVGDVQNVVQLGNHYGGLKGTFARWAARWEEFWIRHFVKRNTAFVLGTALFKKLKISSRELYPAMTSLISDKQIHSPKKKVLNGEIRLLSVSRLSAEKGLLTAIRALELLLSKGYQCCYHLVGDGPLKHELMQIIEKKSLTKNVCVHGKIQDQDILADFYNTSDVFLLPSKSEGIPKVVLEAMAAALPVIASRVGGIPDLLGKDSERGWLVQPDSVSDFVASIEECINDDEMRYQKTQEAHKFIEQHTMEKETERIEKIILND